MGGHRRGERGGDGDICACDPSRESSKKAHVRNLGAGIKSVPPRRYRGRSCGRCHRLGHRAHSAAHHGYWGSGHFWTMVSMRQPSRAAFFTTSFKRLNGEFSHRGPAVEYSHDWPNASSSLVYYVGKRWFAGVEKESLTWEMPGGSTPPQKSPRSRRNPPPPSP